MFIRLQPSSNACSEMSHWPHLKAPVGSQRCSLIFSSGGLGRCQLRRIDVLGSNDGVFRPGRIVLRSLFHYCTLYIDLRMPEGFHEIFPHVLPAVWLRRSLQMPSYPPREINVDNCCLETRVECYRYLAFLVRQSILICVLLKDSRGSRHSFP